MQHGREDADRRDIQTESHTSKETFRHVIGHFASGVTVLTTRDGDEDFGATASAVSSLSLEPPMLLVCLNTRGSTQQAIHASRVFGVNILDEDQGIVAERFASPHGQKFEGLNVERGEGGVPLLADSLAYCECRVGEDVLAGTHRVFLANVTRAVAREGSPLTYFRGKFGRFEVEQDRIVYADLRGRILNRSFTLHDSLDVGTLSKELDVLPATVYHAVTKLVADGLLARDPERGYVVKPVTPESSEHAFDARCAMELGVAAVTVGQVPQERIAMLRALMEETVPLVSEGHFVDVEAYTRAQRGVPQRARRPGRQPGPDRPVPPPGRGGPDGLPAAGGLGGPPGDHRRSSGHRRRLRAGQPARRRRGDQTAQREREGDHPAGDRGCRWRPLTASNDPNTECTRSSAWQTAPMRSVRSSERPRWT